MLPGIEGVAEVEGAFQLQLQLVFFVLTQKMVHNVPWHAQCSILRTH